MCTTRMRTIRAHEEHETLLWTAEIRDGLVAEWRIYSGIEEAKEKAQE